MENVTRGTLILPQFLIAQPGQPPVRDWGVRVVGDVIVDVAPNADLRARFPADRIWEAPRQVLSPRKSVV